MWPFGIGNKYPYTDFHELNTDYLIEKTGKIDQNLKDSETARAGAETAQAAAETAQAAAETAQAAAETAQEGAETAEENTEEYYNNLQTHIAEDVTSWLNTNVNPVGSAVVVDSSLSISGAAADAKVTGQIRTDLNKTQEDLFNEHLPMFFISGSYTDPVNGHFVPYEGWTRTPLMPIPKGRMFKIVSTVGPSTKYNAYFDENGDYLSGGEEADFVIPVGTTTLTAPEGAAYMSISNVTEGMKNTYLVPQIFTDIDRLYHDNYLIGLLAAAGERSHTINLFNQSAVISNAYADNNNLRDDTRWSCSYPIMIDPTKTYNWHWYAPNSAANINNFQPASTYINMYTKDMKYIKRVRVGYESYNEYNYLYDVEWDSNCKYIILSMAHNLFTIDAMMVEGGSDYVFGAFVPFRNSKFPEKAPILNPQIRDISRLGMHKWSDGGIAEHFLPEQSFYAYDNAYNHGIRTMLCDLIFTSDNIPVCFHDGTINRIGRDSNGDVIGTTTQVRNITLAQMNEYDFGYYVNPMYAGTKVVTFEQFLKWAKLKGVDIYVEFKGATQAQTAIACDMVKKYNMVDHVSWTSFYTDNALRNCVIWVRDNIPEARIASMTNGDGVTGTEGYLDFLISLKTANNKVFAFNWRQERLTAEIAQQLMDNDIEYECGSIYTAYQATNYYNVNTGAYYLSGFECDSTIIPSQILRDAASSQAIA